MSKRASINRTASDIAAEIRSELRSILRLSRDLYAPIARFQKLEGADDCPRYYVLFDSTPLMEIQGLELGGLSNLKLPDEPIHDRVLEFAKAVWHLTDRLRQFAKATGQLIDLTAIADSSSSLAITADLANTKKHGRCENRSRRSPKLDLIDFDTSNCGPIEFYYDGAMKVKVLIVTNPVPIPYAVPVRGDDGTTILGDARRIITQGFLDWLPAIRQLGILAGDDRESAALRSILKDVLPA